MPPFRAPMTKKDGRHPSGRSTSDTQSPSPLMLLLLLLLPLLLACLSRRRLGMVVKLVLDDSAGTTSQRRQPQAARRTLFRDVFISQSSIESWDRLDSTPRNSSCLRASSVEAFGAHRDPRGRAVVVR